MGRLRFLDFWLFFALGLHPIPSILAQGIDVPNREILPDAVTPTHYDLALSPDAEALIFRGTVATPGAAKAAYRRFALRLLPARVPGTGAGHTLSVVAGQGSLGPADNGGIAEYVR